MAGHSKWHNIRHAKAAVDAKRGKIFTRILREVTVAVKMGGADISANPQLRTALDNARSNNIPKDTIERAIKKGTGELGADNEEEILYEGYAPGGVAIMVECISDNRNRTVGEVRHAFAKMGGNLGTDGSVSYLFDKKGLFLFSSDIEEEVLLDVALEAGAEDVQLLDDGYVEVITNVDAFHTVREAFVAADLSPEENELSMVASTEIDVSGIQAEKLMKLLDILESLDDVQKVHCNANFIHDNQA